MTGSRQPSDMLNFGLSYFEHPVPCYLNSDMLILTLSDRYRNPEQGIQTWDLAICLYLNLKHGELYHLATMAGLKAPLF